MVLTPTSDTRVLYHCSMLIVTLRLICIVALPSQGRMTHRNTNTDICTATTAGSASFGQVIIRRKDR